MPLKRRNTFSLFLVVLLLAWSKSAVPAAEFTFGKQKITVPDGYTVDLAATLPLTERPIMGDFDSHGRLFIAEASGTNADVQTQLKERPHSILCLEDTNKDGVFDKARGRMVGSQEYLTKPFTKDQLLQAVQQFGSQPSGVA